MGETASYHKILERINANPTAYNVVQSARADSHAFVHREDCLPEEGIKGCVCAVERSGSSVILFYVPDDFDPADSPSFDIVAAHTDSPAFKVKGNPVSYDNGYVRLNVEKYGGMLIRTWLDRPLSVAGRVFVRRGNTVSSRVVDMRDVLRGVIPSLAPHMDRDIESKELSIQNHMRPIIGLASDMDMPPNDYFNELVCKALAKDEWSPAVSPEDIVSYDLFVYDLEKPVALVNEMSWTNSQLAANMVVSPRIDNQASVWCAFEAFLSSTVYATSHKHNAVQVLALFDAEEVGSACASGADSDFLGSVLHHIAKSYGFGGDYAGAMHRSFIVSADGGHALHPGYPSLADPTNPCVLGGGVLVKHSASHAYMTDGASRAVVAEIARAAGIGLQDYYNNSDVRGGATLGTLLSTHVGCAGADVGLPQLAMHSSCECASTSDIQDFIKFFESFYTNRRTRVVE